MPTADPSPFSMLFTRPEIQAGISGIKLGPICSMLVLDVFPDSGKYLYINIWKNCVEHEWRLIIF
jgi:hypothetical protein